MKLSSKILAENYPIDFMACITKVDELVKLRRVYKIPDDINLWFLIKRIPLANLRRVMLPYFYSVLN